MKNKKFTYFLGFLVLVVWGVILYRVFDSLAGDDDDYTYKLNTGKISKEAYNDYEIVQDTTSLQLNYKDPFALQEQKEEEATITQVASPIIPALKPINWNFIKYSGYISNQGAKNLVALVTINGKPFTLSEGETEEQVKLVKNLQDSIKVIFNGNTTYIKKSPAAL